MTTVLIFDTSVASKNLGDSIILDAILLHLKGLFPYARFLTTPTHEKISRLSYRLNKNADYSFVAGTNLLSSNMNSYNQWRINLIDSCFLEDVVLMGVGWWQYQRDPNWYTRRLYKRVLNRSLMHSVRDSYALDKLWAAGFRNVVNTGCPTTWNLTREFCRQVPTCKASNVVFTLTDYNRDTDSDRQLLKLLTRSYEDVFFWPQGTGDADYLKALNIDGIKYLKPSLEAYDELLASHLSLDYIGTRLHAGIRAVQHKRRSVILAVDNRAIEKQKDTNLPVVERGDISALHDAVYSEWATEIQIKYDAIASWKAQFVR